MIKDDKIRDSDILRLLALYQLRYERNANNEFNSLKQEAQRHRRLNERSNHVCHFLFQINDENVSAST